MKFSIVPVCWGFLPRHLTLLLKPQRIALTHSCVNTHYVFTRELHFHLVCVISSHSFPYKWTFGNGGAETSCWSDAENKRKKQQCWGRWNCRFSEVRELWMRHDAEQGLLCTDNAPVHRRLVLKLLEIHLGLQSALPANASKVSIPPLSSKETSQMY